MITLKDYSVENGDVVAVMLTVVILYNLNNINVSERIRELSTIKVLGFYARKTMLYIYLETIILSFIGILCGYLLGDVLYRYILAVVPPDDVMFNPGIGLNAFLIPFIVVAIVTVCLGWLLERRMDRIDMLEALQSVD